MWQRRKEPGDGFPAIWGPRRLFECRGGGLGLALVVGFTGVGLLGCSCLVTSWHWGASVHCPHASGGAALMHRSEKCSGVPAVCERKEAGKGGRGHLPGVGLEGTSASFQVAQNVVLYTGDPNLGWSCLRQLETSSSMGPGSGRKPCPSTR